MSDLIPFILIDEQSRNQFEIDGKILSIVFDGTTKQGETLTVFFRFVMPDTLQIQQRLVRLQKLTKRLSSEEIAREILPTVSTEYGVTSELLLAAMHDRASNNNMAMCTISILYPSVLDIGCYSHTIDHVGEKFSTPTLYELSLSWVILFAHSAKVRVLWRTHTGCSMASYSKTQWWSRWEVYYQIVVQFGDVLQGRRRECKSGVLINFYKDPSRKT